MEDIVSPIKIMKPIQATLFSGEVIQITDSEDERIAKAIKIKNLDIDDVQFTLQSNFQVSDACNICQTFIKEYKNCNICGKVACLPCIRKTINKSSVCDLCFLKKFMRSSRQRQQALIESKKNQASELQKKTQELQKNITREENEISTNNIENDDKETQQRAQLEQKNKEISELEYQINVTKECLHTKQENVDKLTVKLDEEFNTMNRLQGLETTMDTDMSYNDEQYGLKETKFEALSKQQKKILNSKSYLAFQKTNESELRDDGDLQQYEDEHLHPNNNYNPHELSNKLTDKVGTQKEQKQKDNSYAQNSMATTSEYPDKLSLMEREKDVPQEKPCCTII